MLYGFDGISEVEFLDTAKAVAQECYNIYPEVTNQDEQGMLVIADRMATSDIDHEQSMAQYCWDQGMSNEEARDFMIKAYVKAFKEYAEEMKEEFAA